METEGHDSFTELCPLTLVEVIPLVAIGPTPHARETDSNGHTLTRIVLQSPPGRRITILRGGARFGFCRAHSSVHLVRIA